MANLRILADGCSFQRSKSHPLTHSANRNQTDIFFPFLSPANLPTSPVTTRVSNLPVPPSCGNWTPKNTATTPCKCQPYLYIHFLRALVYLLTCLENYRFGTSWGLCVFGMLCVIPVIWYRIHDTELTVEDFVTPAEKGMVMETVKETEA